MNELVHLLAFLVTVLCISVGVLIYLIVEKLPQNEQENHN